MFIDIVKIHISNSKKLTPHQLPPSQLSCGCSGAVESRGHYSHVPMMHRAIPYTLAAAMSSEVLSVLVGAMLHDPRNVNGIQTMWAPNQSSRKPREANLLLKKWHLPWIGIVFRVPVIPSVSDVVVQYEERDTVCQIVQRKEKSAQLAGDRRCRLQAQ